MPRNDMYDAVCSLNKNNMVIFGSTYTGHLIELDSEAAAYRTYGYAKDTDPASPNHEDAKMYALMSLHAYMRYENGNGLDRGAVFMRSIPRIMSVDHNVFTKRHFEDPLTGTCHAAGVFNVPSFFEGIPSGEDLKIIIDPHDFGIMAVPGTESRLANISETTERVSSSGPAERVSANDLHVPFITVAHKKDNGNVVEACNQARACMTGVLRFLHSLGITKVPVYTLLTEGTTGVVIFGWCEDEEYQDNDSDALYTVSLTLSPNIAQLT